MTSPLTREQVFATALRLVDADGVEALSMRRLGKALDRDPMRLFGTTAGTALGAEQHVGGWGTRVR